MAVVFFGWILSCGSSAEGRLMRIEMIGVNKVITLRDLNWNMKQIGFLRRIILSQVQDKFGTFLLIQEANYFSLAILVL
ncbi:hypothetical protein C2G38_831456 [Gigaspora rosea]|uniref:Uncharacterized protein n=1 Tax=Gigaspora rosea TaxID=44941 RepID=A0A397VRE1_9GLOM|nr:hypothetical protein C2G38_831456 [Gigaspora rosea]